MVRSSLSVLLAAVWLAAAASAQTGLADYLPAGVDHDPAVPPPSAVLGYGVGEWHARHDQIVEYMERVAQASARVTLEEYGRSHEGRRLLLLTITSAENQGRIDELRQRHLASADGAPVVAWMGYSVHGDESSGSNAALLFVYHLAAARGREIDRLLARSVVLVDPCINPDGLSRFAHWANMHRGKTLVGDPNHREHRQGWPSGRTNHYWFDLNRDWLLLQHPESRARIERFHAWRPHVLTDFHEMGSSSTYFFQPGVKSRTHPLTPPRNVELTAKIATYHAKALDAIGSLYFSEERFDDFYYGKGSTYPDINGSIGILFEQASSRGHRQTTPSGELTFPFTIRNQLTTSLSTIEAAVDLRDELIAYRREFDENALYRAAADPVKGYVFGDPEDRVRTFHMVDLLRRHRIDIHHLARDAELDGKTFAAASSFVVPASQRQYGTLKALFERRTSFPDETFYDVSAWTLPAAFAMPAADIGAADWETGLLGEKVGRPERPRGTVVSGENGATSPYAWAFDWTSYDAPAALHRLMRAGVRTRAALRPLTAVTTAGPVKLGYGSIVVPAGGQEKDAAELRRIVGDAAKATGVRVHQLTTGLTPQGVDLGSPSLRPLKRPVPLVVVGPGVSAYEAGEVWYLLDHRFGMEVSLVEMSRLPSLDLDDYTHVVLVSGRYRDLEGKAAEELEAWVRRGGTLVAVKSGASWAGRHVLKEKPSPAGGGEDENPEAAGPDSGESGEESAGKPDRVRYADRAARRAQRRIAGAIFAGSIDTTHPLGFGYVRPELPLFRNGTVFLPPAKDAVRNVVIYAESPLISGFVSKPNLARLKKSVGVIADRHGSGVVIRFAENPNFRGFWYGTSKLFLNALFFSQLIDT